MIWRLHLSNEPLRRIHILPPGQIAVHDLRYRYRFYDIDSGGHYADVELDPDLLDNDEQEARREGFNTLKAPNHTFLPFIPFSTSHLYTSLDGNLRLIHDLNAGISLEIEDQIVPLDTGKKSVVRLVAMERELGTMAALTEDNLLFIYQQQTKVNSFPLENVTQLFLVEDGSQLLIIQPDQLAILDNTGKILRSQAIHYPIGLAALSPDGHWLALADTDYRMIRLYNHELQPIRQQYAMDLLLEARQLQLFASLPGEFAPICALDVADDGTLAFAMGGTLCVSHVEQLKALPQTRPLF